LGRPQLLVGGRSYRKVLHHESFRLHKALRLFSRFRRRQGESGGEESGEHEGKGKSFEHFQILGSGFKLMSQVKVPAPITIQFSPRLAEKIFMELQKLNSGARSYFQVW
jgi:hypothetical protein